MVKVLSAEKYKMDTQQGEYQTDVFGHKEDSEESEESYIALS